MDKQPEALRLADELTEYIDGSAFAVTPHWLVTAAAAELRRLYEDVTWMSKTVRLYEELRRIIDDGSESMTHEDAVWDLKQMMGLPKKEKPDGQQTTGLPAVCTDSVRNGGDYTPVAAVQNMGAEWRPFIVEFDTQEGPFTFELWAVDWVHAHDRLEELKASAKIMGEKKGTYD